MEIENTILIIPNESVKLELPNPLRPITWII